MTDLEKAKEIFQKENCTLVLCKGDDVFTSDQTGIKKLVELAEGDKDFSDYSACDKIVGRAAAFLYVLLGVKHVHATVMAKLAIQILDRAEITYSADSFTDAIQNRKNTGISVPYNVYLGVICVCYMVVNLRFVFYIIKKFKAVAKPVR